MVFFILGRSFSGKLVVWNILRVMVGLIVC